MKKVVLYFGPKRAFTKLLPREVPVTTLTELALWSDARQREHVFRIQGRKNDTEEKPVSKRQVSCVVAYSDEYAAITECAVQGFGAFMSQFDVESLYLQNPPFHLAEQMEKSGIDTEVLQYRYATVDDTLLRKLDAEYESRIIGQQAVKEKLLTVLYPLTRVRHLKPVVLLFYGPSGSGKTETARLLADMLGQKLFRKQFSMFHSGEFASYLFGGAHSHISLAKDLMERESNVLLFDEFDKPASVFHSAFYQLFDEGVYHDRNYLVRLERSVIICTTNYRNAAEAMQKLGAPLFSRFDAVIPFSALSEEANRIIIHNEYERQLCELEEEERDLVAGSSLLAKILRDSNMYMNARQVKRAVSDAVSKVLLDRLLRGEKTTERAFFQ